jgi:prevent-host-death family protein
MEIGVRDLRNRTSQVIDAVQAGQRVTLTVHGEPVADIVPHETPEGLAIVGGRWQVVDWSHEEDQHLHR